MKFIFGASIICPDCQMECGATVYQYKGARIWQMCECKNEKIKDFRLYLLNPDDFRVEITSLESLVKKEDE